MYSKIRAGLGGRMRTFCSGGAPLAPELAEFFWSLDVPVYQGYGLTETSPVVTANLPTANKVGTVGRPIPHVQVRIAEDGEILVKGPSVMQGYYRKPDETREVLTADGWFRTGDIGRLDADGYLIITDRKKELLKTAAGKFVAPAPIENMLKTSRLHYECDRGRRQAQVCFRTDCAEFRRQSRPKRSRRSHEFATRRRCLRTRGCAI